MEIRLNSRKCNSYFEVFYSQNLGGRNIYDSEIIKAGSYAEAEQSVVDAGFTFITSYKYTGNTVEDNKNIEDIWNELTRKSNSRKINNRPNFIPDIWNALDDLAEELFLNDSNRTLDNASIVGQGVFATLAQYFNDVEGMRNALINGIKDDNRNVYFPNTLNSRSANSESDKYIVWIHKLHKEYTAEITDSDKGPTMDLGQAPKAWIPVNAILTRAQASKICDKFDSKSVRGVTNFEDILSILNKYARSLGAPFLDKLPNDYYTKIHKSIFGVPSDIEIENLGLNPELFH